MARLLIAALGAGGHQVDLASELRAYSTEEPTEVQAAIAEAGEREVARLVSAWRSGAGPLPDLWFTYHLYYRAPDYLGPAVAEALNIPYAVAEASFAMKRAEGPWALGHAAVARALACASVVFCLTGEDKPGLTKVPGFRARLVDLPPFVAVPENPVTSDVKVAGLSRPVILAVGMMRARAKLESYRLLAAALSRLAGRSWSLAVVGDGPMRAEVQALFTPLGRERVAFLGEQSAEAMTAVYAGADILAWPGFDEAYGMVYLEAQAVGVPVVAMAHRGVPNVVRDGVSGRLVAAGDVAGFASALGDLLDDPASRQALGRSARTFVKDGRSIASASAILNAALRLAVSA